MLIANNTYFKIEYDYLDDEEANDCISIIFQIWSRGEGWTKVKDGNISYETNKKI